MSTAVSGEPGQEQEQENEENFDADHLEEIRQAAGAVVASLKWLLEAAERVVDDPEAFAHVAASGRSVVEAFVGGFTGPAPWPGDGPDVGDEPDSGSV